MHAECGDECGHQYRISVAELAHRMYYHSSQQKLAQHRHDNNNYHQHDRFLERCFHSLDEIFRRGYAYAPQHHVRCRRYRKYERERRDYLEFNGYYDKPELPEDADEDDIDLYNEKMERYEAYEGLINAVDKWIDKMNRLELA